MPPMIYGRQCISLTEAVAKGLIKGEVENRTVNLFLVVAVP